MIVISIIPKSKDQILRLKENYPEYYLEYRLDLTDDWSFIDEETVDERVILTIRDRSEAGVGVIQKKLAPADQKARLYSDWIAKYGCLVDMEHSLLNRLTAPELVRLDRSHLIISIHCYNNNWEIIDIARRCLDIERSGCRYGKLALASDNWEKLLPLETLFKTTSSKILLALMGEDGVSKRSLYRHMGAEGTYVCLSGKGLADGQLTVDLAEKLGLLTLTGKELIGGIIGGEQIINSRGLEYFNNVFREKKLDAVYLPFIIPFIIKDVEDFQSWLEAGTRKNRIYGFSVTMPMKRKIAGKDGKRDQVVNLWDGNKEFFNTDLTAMEQILKENNLLGTGRQVLIIGSGASARTSLKALKGKAEIFITSRNFPEAIRLCGKKRAEYLVPENLKDKYFDLIINTTPLGMKNEDLLDFAAGIDFEIAIDLPYRKGMTPLGRYCRANGKKYISGEEFWQYQAVIQEHYFLASILQRNVNE